MNTQTFTINNLIEYEKSLLEQQRKIYVNAARKINMEMKQIIQRDFGATLAKNCINDIAGEVVRRYFDFGDYYITADQFVNRCLNFSYDDENDILSNNEQIRKNIYNVTDSPEFSQNLKNISKTVKETSQNKLFVEDRSKDGSAKSQKKYKDSIMTSKGKIYDELTGRRGDTTTVFVNGKEQHRSDLQADHIQPRNAATYNYRYLHTDVASLDKLRDFYNSNENFNMIHASANSSKDDLCICEIDGRIEAINAREIEHKKNEGKTVYNVTYKATAEEIADAVVARWEQESKSGKKIEKLKEVGYLDENGKVIKNVKEKLTDEIRKSQNGESKTILEIINKKAVATDALKATKTSFGKIVAGQVIYYVFPPLIFETQRIIRSKSVTLENALSEIKKAGKRVCKYVISKLKEILGNILHNSISKFIKSFFDIIIELVKESVKKLIRIIKQVVMSLVNCVKTISNPKATVAQKADSVIKTIGVTVGNIVLEILFEYLEKQFGLPDFLMEPLQIIVSVLVTNLIMLILEKVDLFNVQYGLIVANIERVFNETNNEFINQSKQLLEQAEIDIDKMCESIGNEIRNIENSITKANFYEIEITSQLNKINRIFNMEIDFELEWKNYIKAI